MKTQDHVRDPTSHNRSQDPGKLAQAKKTNARDDRPPQWADHPVSEPPGSQSGDGVHKADVTGMVALPEGVEMVMPGDNIAMTVELIAPIAMDEGLRFAIREGGRTVGAGVVSSIVK